MLRWCAILMLSIAALAADLLDEANRNYREMHPERAVQLYREYLRSYPDRADVRVFLGGALLTMGSFEEAIAEANRALALDARNAKANVLKGRIYAATEKWNLATKSFDTALRLDPRDADAWYFAGRASAVEERFERAIAQFQQVLKLGVREARVYENLGAAFDGLGQSSEAEQAYRQAVDLSLARQDYHSLLTYGVFLFKQQRMSESVLILRKALGFAPAAPDVRFELGRVLYQSGQVSAAAGILEGVERSSDCRIPHLLSRVLRTQGLVADADRVLATWTACTTAGKSIAAPPR